MASYKYLIVGQGLAGTILSFLFLQEGIPHKVLDDNHKSAATKAAAGIINPITGRRYVKTWMIDELLPAALATYNEMEKLLRDTFLRQTSIIRTFDNQIQENLWNESTSRPGYESYIQVGSNPYAKLVSEPYGYGVIKGACQVDIAKLIFAYRAFLMERNLLIDRSFEAKDLDYEAAEHSVGGDVFQQVIFCEGYKGAENPLFSHLPFQPAKGESLIIKTDINLPQQLLREKLFIAPRSANVFWTGGGYAWGADQGNPTDEFKTLWLEKLAGIWKSRIEVISHLAGIRPSVKGRRPLIGRHKKYPRMILFNGMGTKGTSLAPYWAKHLINSLERKRALSAEVDLNRF